MAVIGPSANSRRDMVGPCAFQYDLPETVTLFEGIRDRLGSVITVETAPGVQMKRNVPSIFETITIPGAAKPEPRWSEAQAAAEFEHASALAGSADLVVLTLARRRT
ncbi:glycoside hydrolase family 3 protein [Croceibacterium mercuriale]|uniref:hypothetical protein n=1 Tax=Croceibacterium mercuriale TaxID=1572751 RepID=UPI001F4235E0|nr:hypothetical protein [Croceibacterium mercuriale]